MRKPSAIESRIRAAVAAFIALAGGMAASAALASDWLEVRQIDGVRVEARATESGFDEHRGTVRVCTDLPVLEAFVADTERFSEWLPYTRHAELLENADEETKMLLGVGGYT